MSVLLPSAPIRLIVSDIDGTLLRRDGTVGRRTLEALREAHRRGVRLVLSSGRMAAAVETIAAMLEIPVFLSGYNGAVIYGLPGSAECGSLHSYNGRERLFYKPLPTSSAVPIVRWGMELGVQVNYYLNETILAQDLPHTRPFLDLYVARTGSPVRWIDSLAPFLDQAPPKVLFVTTPQRREELYAEAATKHKFNAALTRSDPEYLEFMEPSVNKGSGLETLCVLLNLDIRQTMALGDAENDYPLLKAAGWGVAVANACPKVLAAADAVTEADHEHDGVAEAVERWVLDA
jgi:hypothetical protein